jgi:hypothetical protein
MTLGKGVFLQVLPDPTPSVSWWQHHLGRQPEVGTGFWLLRINFRAQSSEAVQVGAVTLDHLNPAQGTGCSELP